MTIKGSSWDRLVKQRDRALAKCKELEAEVEMLRTYEEIRKQSEEKK